MAALHYAVGVDVGAYIVEHLATKLHSLMSEAAGSSSSSSKAGHPLLASKLPNNCLLLLIYLYVFCYTTVLPFFLMVSRLSLIRLLLPACLPACLLS